jgi:hypothetical protein
MKVLLYIIAYDVEPSMDLIYGWISINTDNTVINIKLNKFSRFVVEKYKTIEGASYDASTCSWNFPSERKNELFVFFKSNNIKLTTKARIDLNH